MIVGDRVIGVFAAQRGEARRWTSDEIALIEAVAQEVGLAIHAGRLLQENRRRLDEQTALLEAAQVLTEDLDPDRVLGRLVAEAVRLVGADAADCWILDDDDRTLRCRAVHGLPDSEVGRRIAPEGTLGEALESGRPVLRRRFAETEQPPPSASYARFAEVMDAPIVVGGRVRGVLGVCAEKAGTLCGRAARAAGGVRAASRRSRCGTPRRTRSARARPACSAASRDRLAARRAAVARADARGGRARGDGRARRLRSAPSWLRDGEGLALAGGRDLPQALAGGSRAASPSRARSLEAVASGRILAARALAADERFAESPEARRHVAGASSLLVDPRSARRSEASPRARVLRGRAAHRGRRPRARAASRRRGARGARAEPRCTRRSGERGRSRSSSPAPAALLATELDPAAVLDEVVRQARRCSASRPRVRLVEDDELVVIAVEGVAEADASLGDRSPSTGWLVGEVGESRAPVARRGRGLATSAHAAADPIAADAACAPTSAVPLVGAEGALLGVLVVYAAEPRPWRDDEIEALAALAAGRVGGAPNAELYQRVAIEKERSFAILANIADGIVAVDRDGERRALEPRRRGDHGRPCRRGARPRRPQRCSGAASKSTAT